MATTAAARPISSGGATLIGLPLAVAAVWLGSRVAAGRSLSNSRSDTLVRGLLIALMR
jgi:hypothetical protein